MKNRKSQHIKRLKNAMQRSETVFRNDEVRRGVVRDEITYFDFDDVDNQRVLTETTAGGILEPKYEIRMKGRINSEEGITAVCSCKTWSYGPSRKLSDIAGEISKHRTETAHQLREH